VQTGSMTAIHTARERARAELTREIKDEARRQLVASGAAGLSLRAVARELGMVSSALYRYFPSRDDLLTALIIDAYNALGEHAEAAAAAVPQQHFRSRFRAICAAVREWAVQHPNEYALVYGTPVPGYRAPEDTVQPGIRVPLALVTVLGDAWSANALAPTPPETLPTVLADQVQLIAMATQSPLPGAHLVRGAMVWSQLFGLANFEVFGQFANSLDPADAFFAYSVERMADFLGLLGDADD
jgi:AcrR family transcriptional regulator